MENTRLLNDASPIKIALIATYPKMAEIVKEVAKEKEVILYDEHISFNEAVIAANRLQHTVDAILTRGGTGDYVRRSVSIPVISIPITPFDLVLSIQKLAPTVKTIAFFNFQRYIYGVRDIERMFNIKIHEYIFNHQIDLERGVQDVKNKGIEVLIGGAVAANLANKLNITGIEINSNREAI
ncbi:MAG: PrpR N-terminal domain-containing protein, partial [Oscillospiraceae bacterium]|nr:PrpR N-terminal domain-containing protein [Oscillospiraceae bacterium]